MGNLLLLAQWRLQLRSKTLVIAVFGFFMLAGVPAASGADIVVRLINARTGEPVRGKPVRVWLIDGGPPYIQRRGYLEQKSAADGTAVFRVGEPLPSYIGIRTGMGGRWEDCIPNDQPGYDVKEILASGISQEGYCGQLPKIDKRFSPKPGEVYLFAVHLTFWEKLKEPGEGFPR